MTNRYELPLCALLMLTDCEATVKAGTALGTHCDRTAQAL